VTPTPKQPEPEERPSGEIRLAAGVVVPEAALEFTYVSSSGPGGQNVNRRSTKARLRLKVADLALRPAAERRLRNLAGSLITDEDELIIASDSTRSQRANREDCLDRLKELVARSLVAPKPRKKTKPTRGSVERRLKEKRIRSQRKSRRQGDADG